MIEFYMGVVAADDAPPTKDSEHKKLIVDGYFALDSCLAFTSTTPIGTQGHSSMRAGAIPSGRFPSLFQSMIRCSVAGKDLSSVYGGRVPFDFGQMTRTTLRGRSVCSLVARDAKTIPAVRAIATATCEAGVSFA
ncbi:MAG TPA: hypothetical protein PK282_05655 [Rhodoglobus sp.]|nr:hypothetical protein [Rhodoglobus sp.]